MAATQSYPLYWDAKEALKNVTCELTEEQQEQRARDREMVKAIDDYYKPYREIWRRNGALFNLAQVGTDDITSNWYLGWVRLLTNHSMAMMSAGNPKGAFRPVGRQDLKMEILVSALVDDAVNKCNWNAHQRLWLQDLHISGNGVTDSYSERPMRKQKIQRGEKLVEKIVRDHRRSKVGIRRVSPFRAMRSHFISDPDDVPFSVKLEEGTWNQYVMRYANAINPDGSKKYDTDQIPAGSHYRAVHLYDELENCYRTYLITYNGRPEQTLPTCPPIEELGYPIYDKPLSHYKFIDQGRTLVGGANLPGMSPLAFATYEDQLDQDMETYSICGMGLPQLIEAPEAILHGLVNMSFDNERLISTVPISYEPNGDDSPSALDLDVRSMYSGLVVDGKITPQPLGSRGAGSNQVLWEWLKFVIYQLSGINPEMLTGDSLQTAYQSGLLVRQMNMRAKAKISAWENGPLKRAWQVLGANALSDVTAEEWEEITEDDAKRIQEEISRDEATAEDYRKTKDETGTVYERRKMTYIPVKGYKFRETFKGKNKKRTLNASSADNTLIEDPTMPGDGSDVPADAKYLFPSGAVDSIMQYRVTVDGSGMLQDLKTQDMETMKGAIENAQLMAKLDPNFIKDFDSKKTYLKSIEPTGLTEEDVMKSQDEASTLEKAFEAAAEQMNEQALLPPQPNAAAPGTTGTPGAAMAGAPAQADPARSPGQQGEQGGASSLVGDLANGSV